MPQNPGKNYLSSKNYLHHCKCQHPLLTHPQHQPVSWPPQIRAATLQDGKPRAWHVSDLKLPEQRAVLRECLRQAQLLGTLPVLLCITRLCFFHGRVLELRVQKAEIFQPRPPNTSSCKDLGWPLHSTIIEIQVAYEWAVHAQGPDTLINGLFLEANFVSIERNVLQERQVRSKGYQMLRTNLLPVADAESLQVGAVRSHGGKVRQQTPPSPTAPFMILITCDAHTPKSLADCLQRGL